MEMILVVIVAVIFWLIYLIYCTIMVSPRFDSYLYLDGGQSLLPVNGFEPEFTPERWVQNRKYNNCYAYALDNHKWRESKPQPNNVDAERYNCSDLKRWIQSDLVDGDGNKYPLKVWGRDIRCPDGYHKIYLVVSGDDYHFYRQDSDGMWSHKPGSNGVTRLDAKGREIADPSEADHDYGEYNYKDRCGFMCVPKIDEKF